MPKMLELDSWKRMERTFKTWVVRW